MVRCDTVQMSIADEAANPEVDCSHLRLRAQSDPKIEFLIYPGSKVALNDIDPGYHGDYESPQEALPETRIYRQKIDELQCAMYAERRHSLLIVLQGIDAGGKDGVVRHLLSTLNPAGCRVIGFKQPTSVELGHDFLWRVHPHVPMKGEVSIFNRSHYEDVLAVRVHRLVTFNVWSNRYQLINEFERLLFLENNTTILKFFLHISKAEQLIRFRQRLEEPARQWKISELDYRERAYWDDYICAFEDMLSKTSTYDAPWFVIPSNNRWYRDLIISQIVARKLENLGIIRPEPSVDITRIRCHYHAAEMKAHRDRQRQF